MRYLTQESSGFQAYEIPPPPSPTSPPANRRPRSRPGFAIRIEPRVIAAISRYDGIINRVSAEVGVDGKIIRGIIAAESGGNPNSGSQRRYNGYKGLMQAGRDPAQYDPETSIRTGARKFVQFRRSLYTHLGRLGLNLSTVDRETMVRWVATSYNAGPGTVIKAVEYARAAGNAGNWMELEHFQRALIHTGAYSIAEVARSCQRAGRQPPNPAEIAAASQQRLNLKRRNLTLAQIRPNLSPLLLCAVEFKHRNIPRYVERILTYMRHFDRPAASPARESFEFFEDDFGLRSNFENWQNALNRRSAAHA